MTQDDRVAKAYLLASLRDSEKAAQRTLMSLTLALEHYNVLPSPGTCRLIDELSTRVAECAVKAEQIARELRKG